MDQKPLEFIRLLLARLERISVDSYWAHRASGVRGQLLRMLEEMEAGKFVNSQTIRQSYESAIHILIQAAREKYR